MSLRRVFVAIATGKGLALVGFVVAACASSPSGPVSPGPAATPPATAIASAETPFAPLLDAAWLDGRHGCAEQSMLAVDDLAAALMSELDAPRLDARLEASRYVRDRCA